MGKYLDLPGLERVTQSIQQKLRNKQDTLSPDSSITIKDNVIGVSKEYMDGLLGDIGTILDNINGEVV